MASGSGTIAQANRNPFIDHPEYAAAIWGNTCLPGVIPVTYTEVTAKTNKDGVLVSWNIENQINIDTYEIQRSNDGVNFYAIGKVIATNITNYSFVDNNLQKNGLVFYRIKAVEPNGKFNISKIVSVKIYSANGLLIYPNPASSILNIKLNKTITTKSNLQITDVTGKTIKLQTLNVGEINVTINVNNFASGKYFVKIVSGSVVINESFVIAR